MTCPQCKDYNLKKTDIVESVKCYCCGGRGSVKNNRSVAVGYGDKMICCSICLGSGYKTQTKNLCCSCLEYNETSLKKYEYFRKNLYDEFFQKKNDHKIKDFNFAEEEIILLTKLATKKEKHVHYIESPKYRSDDIFVEKIEFGVYKGLCCVKIQKRSLSSSDYFKLSSQNYGQCNDDSDEI